MQNKTAMPIAASIEDVSPINRVTNDIDTQMSLLRDNIMSLDRVFSNILKPDEQEKKVSESDPVPPMAPLEHWLREHLYNITTCNDRIANYKSRCQL